MEKNEKVSDLGFGCMRLPTIVDNPMDIDEKNAISMSRHALIGCELFGHCLSLSWTELSIRT